MSSTAKRTSSLSMRCYRVLLRAYPRAFLVEFEELLCQAFGDLSQRAMRTQGAWGMLQLWLRTIPDLIASALSQRLRSNSDWSFRLRWIAACGTGALLGVVFMVELGYAVDRVLAMSGMPPLFPRSVPRYPILYLQYAASGGLVLGFFQSLAFEWKRSRRLAWILVTMLGVTFAVGGVLMVPVTATYLRVTINPWRLLEHNYPFLFYSGSAALCASILGMLQTLLLARKNPRALLWIPVSAIGIAACGFLLEFAMTMMRRPHGILRDFSYFGLIAGIAYGILTALPLEWILQPRCTSELPADS